MKSILLAGCIMAVAGSVVYAAEKAPPAQQTSKQPANPRNGFSGKVMETMDAGDYTYVLVQTGKDKNWAAAPKFPVKVGDAVTVVASMPMPKYHSKILNRDFDVVYFTDRVSVNGTTTQGSTGQMPQLPRDHPPIDGLTNQLPALPQGHPAIGNTSTKPSIQVSGIKKAEGGKTVAEVYADKAKLKGKEVKLRGKVVKFNDNIMGKNWLHLRDGSGKEGSNDLLVTSTQEAKVGDTILVVGVLSTDKDFGANYKYPVMVENAKITVE